MKKINILFVSLLSTCIIFTACDSGDDLIEERINDNPVVTNPPLEGEEGNINLSTYVAIGNSLTAGYMDGALYNDGQWNSFPNILANHFQALGFLDDEFKQPDINSELGFNTTVPNPQDNVVIGRYELDISLPGPRATTGGDPIAPFAGDKNDLNNFGVPGILVGQLLTPATGGPMAAENPAFNPFYARFATTPGVSTILGDALSVDPTFYTLWIGNGDVLGYATSGGDGSVPITATGDFQNYYTQILTQLTQAGAKGVAITIPPVLTIPYFRAVPYNPIPLQEAQANALNQAFGGFNAALDAIVANMGHPAEDANRRKINYQVANNNPILIVDEDLEDLSTKFDMLQGAGAISAEQRAALQPYVQARPATASDLIPMATRNSIGMDVNPAAPGTALLGISVPMGDKYILTPQEQVAIVTARATYNGIISGVAAAMNSNAGTTMVAVMDVGPIFADLAGLSPTQAAQLALSEAAQARADSNLGMEVQGFEYQPDFSPNGIYSTDGIHPNPKGHVIIANEIINVMNSAFGSDIPEIDVVPFRTVIIY